MDRAKNSQALSVNNVSFIFDIDVSSMIVTSPISVHCEVFPVWQVLPLSILERDWG
jgi:hypothetical protein